jgi:hypothetical protein
MHASLIKSLINPVPLALLVASGLIIPALPILACRLFWLICTNPLKLS